MAILVSSGQQALVHAQHFAETAGPITMNIPAGRVDIRPGTYDRQEGYLVLGQSYNRVYYLRGNNLYYETPVDAWARGYVTRQIIDEVQRRTRLIIPAAQITMAFTMGLAAGAFGVLATVASVTVLAFKVIVFYTIHKARVDRAAAHLERVVRALRWFRDNCPDTYRQLKGLMRRGLQEALLSVPEGIRAPDIAVVVGRFLGGLANAPETGLAVLARVLAKAAAGFAVRVPAMAARGSAERAREAADGLIRGLQDEGINVSPEARNRIRQCFERNPQAVAKLQELHESLSEATPVLQDLARQLQVAQAD